jgi:hypothetical protein
VHNEDRLYRNKLGQDPAHLAETSEPINGFGRPYFRYCSPSPAASKLMEQCIEFAHLWRNSYELAVDVRWNRQDAVHKINQVKSRCRELNIRLLREYLPMLRGENKMRAYRTIANLEAQQH